MTLDPVTKAINALDEHACCEGTYTPTERIALQLPDGDVGAVDDKNFVDWLLAHAEPAPYGEGGETKVDTKVRDAFRLTARGKVDVSGFDPKAILGEIEAVLSPRTHLAAKLTDVLVYRKGGKFARHKDTPRSPSLLGTLIVGLPIEHEGGAFVVDDGSGDPRAFDWSGKPDAKKLPWVALFSDVDHEVEMVTKGDRVTLVYSLSLTSRERVDPTWEKRKKQLRAALQPLARRGGEWPVMIACARHVITDAKSVTAGVEALRGADREIAECLEDLGLGVSVRSCITAAPAEYGTDNEPPRFPDTAQLWRIHRLKKPIAKKDVAKLDYCVTFAKNAVADEGEMPASSLAAFLLDGIRLDRWVIRQTAGATYLREAGLFSDSGYFGNEGYEAHLYTLAALEVTKGKSKARAKAKAKPKPKAKAKKK
jgi:hypothetical protein